MVEVSKGITSSIKKSTTTSQSGIVMTKTMITLNEDISSAEESGSTSSSVDQTALFTEVTSVIKTKFDAATSSQPVTPGDIMFVVIKAVNDKLGESVSKMVETAELYVNVLNGDQGCQ